MYKLILLLLACSIYYFQVRQKEGDLIEYKQTVAATRKLQSKKQLEKKPAEQVRTGVQKDIWKMQDGQRTHFRLSSEGSDLIVHKKHNKFEFTEHLHNLTCCMQEEINSEQNRQEIRTLTSAEGVYDFPSHRFLAPEVDLRFFRLSGTDLPPAIPLEQPYLRGKAFDVAFKADGKALQFHAHHLKAILQ